MANMQDSEFIQDLLECSVCLEQLTDQSKVLPCQHTFCRKCLAEIISTHNELRCPECRIKVDITSLDQLPPNILLIRLLEGIKNNIRKTNKSKGVLATAITSCVETTTKLPTAQDLQTTGSKCVLTAVMKTSNVNPTISSAFPLPVRARALFDYEGNECTDLSFKRNEIITIRQQTDANWCIGELNGKQGFLPISFVQVIEEMNASKRASGHLHTMITAAASNAVVTLPRPLPNAGRPLNGNSNDATNLAHAPQRTHNVTTIVPMASNNLTHSTTATAVNTNTSATTNSIMNVNLMSLQQMQITSPMCRALYDFRVADVADKSCLCFAKHDLILFIRKVDDNWAEGRIGNRVGIFPISFVEMLPPGSTSTSTQSASRTLNMNELAGISNHKPMKAVENQSLSNTCSGTDTEDEARRTSYSNGTDESIRLTATTNKITFSAGNARSNSLNSTTMIPSGPQNRPPPPYAIAANSSNLIVASRATAGGCIANTAVASDCLPLQTSNANAIYETLIGTTTSSSSTPALTNKRHSLCLLPGAPAIPRLCSKSTRSNKSTYGCSLATNENTLNAFQSLELLTDAAIKGNSSSTRQPSVANNSNSFDNLLSIRSNASLELYVALYNYKPQKADELELRKNDLYLVHEKCLDGWFKGSSQCGKQSGVFPGNYVQPICNPTTSYQNSCGNRRSFGNLSATRFESAENLLSNGANGTSKSMRQMSSSVEDQLNYNDFNRIVGLDDEDSCQWHQAKVAATMHCSPPFDATTSLPDKTTGQTTRPDSTPIKRDLGKKVNLIRLFSSRKSRPDKMKGFFCDNPTFVDVSPKN